MNHLIPMSSSWRECSLSDTLSEAKILASKLGIARVTDITRLDRIGIPVYSSIRPCAKKGSLCVNAGKGFFPEEAKVGAYMEAIEFSLAEFRDGFMELIDTTPEYINSQINSKFNFVDLCPIFGVKVKPSEKIVASWATDFFNKLKVLVPAELIFSPFNEIQGQALFGNSTNGLSSGNSIKEATLHGLCEVLERDVQAFNYIDDNSVWVNHNAFPEKVQKLCEKVKSAGFLVGLRFTQNKFNLPYFQAFIIDKGLDPISISHGTALHLSSEISAVRAITEAAQSRLSYIHGGRDDLTARFKYFEQFDKSFEHQEIEKFKEKAMNTEKSIDFSNIPDFSNFSNIDSALNHLKDCLSSQGINQVLIVPLSTKDIPLAVVKVIVPKLESFNPSLKRIGPRLSSFIKGLSDD